MSALLNYGADPEIRLKSSISAEFCLGDDFGGENGQDFRADAALKHPIVFLTQWRVGLWSARDCDAANGSR
jgi:hypothetical protein